MKDQIAASRWNRSYNIGGAAALIAGTLFLIAIIDLLITALRPGVPGGRSLPFQDNWLVLIFKLLAGYGGVQIERLQVLDALDIVLLAFVGLTVLGLYAVLHKAGRIWSLIALVQPLLGWRFSLRQKMPAAPV